MPFPNGGLTERTFPPQLSESWSRRGYPVGRGLCGQVGHHKDPGEVRALEGKRGREREGMMER